MADIPLFSIDGTQTGTMQVSDDIFGVTPDPHLVHIVATAQAANAFVPYAHTKTRGEVRGGGRKPWRQKGTGRARQGSIRSPQWVGGGVVFGPRSTRAPRQKIHHRMRRQALAMAVSDKVTSHHFFAIESFEGVSGKTAQLAQFVKKLSVANRSVMIATGSRHEALMRAARNLPNVQTISARSINVLDVLTYRYLLCDREAIDVLSSQLSRV